MHGFLHARCSSSRVWTVYRVRWAYLARRAPHTRRLRGSHRHPHQKLETPPPDAKIPQPTLPPFTPRAHGNHKHAQNTHKRDTTFPHRGESITKGQLHGSETLIQIDLWRTDPQIPGRSPQQPQNDPRIPDRSPKQPHTIPRTQTDPQNSP